MTTTQRNVTLLGLGGVLLLLAGAAAYYIPRMDEPVDTYVATSTPSVTTNSTTTPTGTTTGNAPVAITSNDVTTSETAASLSGTVRPNGLYTSYWFEYGTTQGFGNRSSVQNIGSGYQTLKATGYVSNLAKNTKYYYRLVAQNEVGKAIGTTYTFQTEAGAAPVGSLPTIKTTSTSDITANAATIHGEVTPNQADTSYWFEYGKTKDFGQISSVKSAGAGTTKVNVTSALAGLDAGTTYYYRINAQNRFGTVNGLTVTFKTTGSIVATTTTSAPTVHTIAATSIATSSATLRGTVNPQGLETTYWFEYSTDSLLGSVLLSSTTHTVLAAGTTTTSVSATPSGLSAKTNYYYRAVAQNSKGVTYGDKVTFKTK